MINLVSSKFLKAPSLKNAVMRMKKVTNQNIILANLVSNKEVVPPIYKEFSNLMVRNQTTNIKNKEKNWTDT